MSNTDPVREKNRPVRWTRRRTGGTPIQQLGIEGCGGASGHVESLRQAARVSMLL